MSAARLHSFRSGGISRSKSEGTLIDFDDQKPPSSNSGKSGKDLDLLIDWTEVFHYSQNVSKSTNPFRNGLSESNPFLCDVVKANTHSKDHTHVSILKEDPYMFFRDPENRNSFASSGDELDINHLLVKSAARRSARSKSVSALDILDGTGSEVHDHASQILAPDLEWLQNDREAYKMAWLSHRQLTRSCLDLDLMSQSPGWAQTQATDKHIVCQIDHEGGSVQLPNSSITVHVPQGHVAPGEYQDISLKAILNTPAALNNNLSTTVSPVLEITLSNINTIEVLLLEMKIAVEVKQDPYSQVMTEIVTFYSHKKDGPFERLPDAYIYNNMLQIKLPTLSRITYIVTAAQMKSIQHAATSVYDHIHKSMNVAIYGPKHIHPSFTTVLAVIGHNYTPEKLTINDIKKHGKNMPPVVFQLWGKQEVVLDHIHDLSVSFLANDSNFEVKPVDNGNEIHEQQLKTGKMIRMQFPFSLKSSGDIHSFVFMVQIMDQNNSSLVSEFTVETPSPAPKIQCKSKEKTRLQKRKEIVSAPLPLIYTIKYPKFQDKILKINTFGVTLKTVLRQQKIDYLLEYFKGDTIAFLGEDKVKAIGQTKIKEWYVGLLRGKVGLVHCKNVKIISKEQVIDFPDAQFTTQMLLEQIALPFKKLTYIYSSVLSLVSEKVYDWKCLADVLGYSHLPLDEICHTPTEKESEGVSSVVKKLKEDCHADSKKRRFHYELIMGLLKMDCQGLVARLTQDTVILTAAVQLGVRWRELAEKLARLTKQQIEAYEIPHQGKTGEVSLQMMWKPAFDFLYTWAAHYGESYRDVLQDLHCELDKMKYPVTRQWRELTGALIFVNCLEIYRMTAFSKFDD